ncbi:MAG: hypothetical protein COB10_04545 [Planctomycetota bacterium]|nr:MAG: hypothetical protein COB10_04545 [Planctomycetota bacterium]
MFGHTHEAVVEEHQGILLVNPGSPVLPMQIQRLGQVAILEHPARPVLSEPVRGVRSDSRGG